MIPLWFILYFLLPFLWSGIVIIICGLLGNILYFWNVSSNLQVDLRFLGPHTSSGYWEDNAAKKI